MRIPQLLFGCWTGQGQVSLLDLVLGFCTGIDKAGISGISGMCQYGLPWCEKWYELKSFTRVFYG